MITRIDYRDVIGGALLTALGLFIGLYASAHYTIGTLSSMGPGMLPAALGFIMAALGLVVLVPALFRAGTLPMPHYRAVVAVLGGTLLFALTMDVLGMVPAIVLLTVCAVLADNKLGVVGTLVLAAILSVMAILIFRVGLNIALSPFIWPF